MNARGALIFPFVAEIARMDYAATAADPDGAGPLAAGFDPDYREPVVLPTADGVGQVHRVESTTIRVRAQIEPVAFDRLQMAVSGDARAGTFDLVFHFADLELAGLVDPATGVARIRKNDRLVAVYNTAGALVQAIDPPLYAIEARPIGWGLGLARNLLLVRFDRREPG